MKTPNGILLMEPNTLRFPESHPVYPFTVNGEYAAYAWPGGYPTFAITRDGGCLCESCVNRNRYEILTDPAPDWEIVAVEVNWEDPELYCDNCNARIESAYAEEDV